eukprot:CAMPEP_0115701712 /NCGR_PEP_ID=MMETSP0272-20121206/68123_1 /TAXON_ID=71861 /ORGANISM="Scrippsiella trochoidea, Strain CCMP3099" /LENGTH=47 /DNA_ID= /DNA_START= /DNA_END= /DNA_ORIENTATION=
MTQQVCHPMHAHACATVYKLPSLQVLSGILHEAGEGQRQKENRQIAA